MKHVERYTPLFFLKLSLTLLFVMSGCLSVSSERAQEQHTTTTRGIVLMGSLLWIFATCCLPSSVGHRRWC